MSSSESDSESSSSSSSEEQTSSEQTSSEQESSSSSSESEPSESSSSSEQSESSDSGEPEPEPPKSETAPPGEVSSRSAEIVKTEAITIGAGTLGKAQPRVKLVLKMPGDLTFGSMPQVTLSTVVDLSASDSMQEAFAQAKAGTQFRAKEGEYREELKAKLQELFQQIRLVWCKKCSLQYCPAVDKDCYRYFHKGHKQGMEEVDVDEDGNEKVYEHWSCCGECVKGDVPTQCGREPNGEHEPDTSKGEVSSFSIKEVQVSNKQ